MKVFLQRKKNLLQLFLFPPEAFYLGSLVLDFDLIRDSSGQLKYFNEWYACNHIQPFHFPWTFLVLLLWQ